MKITRIAKQERRDRYNLFVDDEFRMALSAGVLADSGLGENDVVTEAEIERLVREEHYAKILAKAYDYLSRRPHSTGELRIKLFRKDYPKHLVFEVLEHLAKLEYLDDTAFAKQWVALRGTSRGPRLLRAELKKRLVPDATIAEVLEETADEDDLLEKAQALAETRLSRYRNLPERQAREKLSAYLAGRGYDYGIIRQAVEAAQRELTKTV